MSYGSFFFCCSICGVNREYKNKSFTLKLEKLHYEKVHGMKDYENNDIGYKYCTDLATHKIVSHNITIAHPHLI